MFAKELAKSLIRKYEGLRLEAYKCPAGVWTIGYGETENVTEGMVITKERAEELLESKVVLISQQVENSIKVPITDNQLAALIDFVYNLGIGNFRTSTMLRILNEGKYEEAAEQLLRWTKSSGKQLLGLVKRREEERELFLK